MAKITKQSLAEFAKAMAALDTADQEWILSREEMQSFSAGRDEMAAYFGDNQRDQANHVLAGLGNDLLTTEVGGRRQHYLSLDSVYYAGRKS